MPREPKNPDYDKFFEFPEKLLNSIAECVNGGYLMFFVDQNGNLDCRANFQTQMHEEAVRSFATRYLNTLGASMEISETQDFLEMGGDHGPDCEDFEGGEED